MTSGWWQHVGSATVALGLIGAPFQCGSDPDPSRAREETPGEALYGLASDFKASGDRDAQVRTLKYIIERYPSSRFAETARADLGDMGIEAPERGEPSAPAAPASQAAPSVSASSPAAPSGSVP